MPTDTALVALTEALQRRSLALFIGADLSREITGLPSRADLAADLARRYSLDERLPLADVAARVSQAGNRFECTQFLRDALDTAGKSPQPFHRRIATLVKEHGIATIITVAYDNLLELAFSAAGIGINRVVRGADVSFIGPDRPTLLKLYGDVMQPDTLVVTDRDHTGLLRDREREPLLDEVRQALRRNTILFLGYSLADPDFRFLFDQVAESRFARTAYAVWPGLAEADVRMWRDRGIAILGEDPLGALSSPAAPAPATPQPQQIVALPPGGSQTIASGAHSVAIGGNVSGSVIIIGDGNVVGDGSSSTTIKERPMATRMAHSARARVGTTPTVPRVLVVDDSRDSRQRLVQLLQRLGCDTSQAETNRQALDLLSSASPPFTLVTTDAFRRPENAGESGYVGLNLIKTINSRLSGVPVVLVSRDDPEFLRKQAPNLRVAALLGKDLSDEEVTGTLRRVLNGEIVLNQWSKTPDSRHSEALRNLLTAAFSDEELTTLAFDHFRPVYEDFASGMSKSGKIQKLLEYCDRQVQIETLLAIVQKANPAQYRRYEEQLRG